jgi:hypothetical protein
MRSASGSNAFLILEHAVNSHGLGQNTLALPKDRVVRICLIIDLVGATDSTDNPGVRQLLQFPLRRSQRSFGLSDQIPGLLGAFFRGLAIRSTKLGPKPAGINTTMELQYHEGRRSLRGLLGIRSEGHRTTERAQADRRLHYVGRFIIRPFVRHGAIRRKISYTGCPPCGRWLCRTHSDAARHPTLGRLWTRHLYKTNL